MKKLVGILLMCSFLASSEVVKGQSLAAFERNVTEHTLDNGLQVIIVKRDVAPVATFMTFVNVGGVHEPVGMTGVAHIFEHMAFKGSTRIGTNNWEAEQPLLKEIDETYTRWLREARSPNPNQHRADSLLNRFNELEEKAKEYVVRDEFSMIIDREGGVGLNAGTGPDFTFYFYSLPQNKAEMWFSLEAERFLDPVLREFYVEKDVVYEERRMRTDSNPIGRLIEEFVAVAYTALPYRDALVGWPSDIESLTIEQALEFYRQYYVPSNMFIVIVGDVDPAKMIEHAELYFGGMEETAPAPLMTVEEPRQRGERRFIIEDQSQPVLISGYKTVGNSHPDYLPLDILSGILFEGRASRMTQKLVDEEKLALAVQGLFGFAGEKYTAIFGALGVPNQGVDIYDLEQAINREIERIKNEGVTKEELERVVTRRRAGILRQLGSNMGITFLLGQNQSTRGDWRTVFTDLDRMQQLTVEDIQRVANQYLVKDQRTVGILKNVEPEPTASN